MLQKRQKYGDSKKKKKKKQRLPGIGSWLTLISQIIENF